MNNLESVTVRADTVDSEKSLGTVVLLSLEPLVTSLLALFLGLFSSDEVKLKRYKLRRMITQLDESIAELEASVSCRKRTEQEELDTDERLMQLAVQDVGARAAGMRSAARQYLTEFLKDPSSITVLSHELDDETAHLLDETQVRFVGDRAVFVDEQAAKSSIRTVADNLIAHGDSQVYIIGTTATGDRDFCAKLSTDRAEAVKKVLVEMGVAEERMIVYGLGYWDPWHVKDVDSKGTWYEENASQNRKVMPAAGLFCRLSCGFFGFFKNMHYAVDKTTER